MKGKRRRHASSKAAITLSLDTPAFKNRLKVFIDRFLYRFLGKIFKDLL